MAYSEVSDIESDFKDIDFLAAAATPTSLVTEEDVEQFIVEADALINSYLSMRYVTPVTGGSEALELLKLYSRSLVSSRVKGILEVAQKTNNGANQNVREGLSTKDVLKLLEDLRDNKTSLTDATLLAVSGVFYSKNYANQVCHTMKKGVKQW